MESKAANNFIFVLLPRPGAPAATTDPPLQNHRIARELKEMRCINFLIFFSPDWPLFTRLLLPVLCTKSLFVHAHGSLSGGEGEVGNQPAVRSRAAHHEPSRSPCDGLVCVCEIAISHQTAAL